MRLPALLKAERRNHTNTGLSADKSSPPGSEWKRQFRKGTPRFLLESAVNVALTGGNTSLVEGTSGASEQIGDARAAHRSIVEEARCSQQLIAPSHRGGPLPPVLRAAMEDQLGGDFSKVTIHQNERENTQRLQAKAYTVGQDIVFHEGAYRQGTEEGRELLAHELAHTRQSVTEPSTAGRVRVSQPGDVAERAAETSIRKGTALNLSTPAGSVLRSAFDSEDPTHRARRLGVIDLARSAADRLRTALSYGYVWTYFETVTSGGITARHIGDEETLGRRESRLRQVIGDLIGLVRDLETAPVPTTWLAPTVRDRSGTLDASSTDPTWTDTVRFYAHRGVGTGRSTELLYINIPYIERAPTPSRTVARVPISRGVNTGIYISVPDPDNEPLIYTRVTGFERLPGRGVILDVWSDDFGYYYLYKGAQHYLPGRP